MVEALLLCIENEQSWQDIVKRAANDKPGVRVDLASDYLDATRYIRLNQYDVCSIDSRLGSNEPRLHELIKLARDHWGDSTALVALTEYSRSDLSQEDKGKLFKVVPKDDALAEPDILKSTLWEALHSALCPQASEVWKALQDRPKAQTEDELIGGLAKLPASVPPELRRTADAIVEKYRIYADRRVRIPKTMLDCTGFVDSIRGDEVEVVLQLPDGQQSRRLFDGSRFMAAGVYFQDAQFHYTITREGADVYSRIEATTTPQEVPEVDLTVFERFQARGETDDD